MRINIPAVVAAAILCAGAAHAQVQSAAQQKCVNLLNKDGAKVSKSLAKLQAGCIKEVSTLNTDADACIAADAKQTVANASAKTSADDSSACSPNLPTFAYAGATYVNVAATEQRQALLTDLLGSPVHPGVVSQATDKAVSVCQGKVLKSLNKLMSAKLKVFNTCKKTSLLSATSASVIETDCVAAIEASAADGKVATAIAKTGAARAKLCDDADLATAFPGVCSAELGVGFDDCVESRTECRTCLTLNVMDDLDIDCDLFDDAVSNDSCQLDLDCIYVSASLGTPVGDGSSQDPLDTIGNGILTALMEGVPAVCVSGETYSEQVTMESGISVLGGHDHTAPGFPFSPSATTNIQAVGTAVLADGIDDDTSIENVTILAQPPTVPGSSTYGVRLTGGSAELTIRDSVIHAAKGANGSAGVDGTPHVAPTAATGGTGSNGCSNCGSNPAGGLPAACTEPGGKGGNGGNDSQTGQTGSPGTGAAPGGPGGVTSACFGGGNDGGPGGSVGGGNQGSAGSAGGALGTGAGGFYVPADGGNGSTGNNGKGGSGGGGGGGGGTSGGFCNADGGGGGGAGGCGGLGGNFGRGGSGAGASFGVFATAGTLTVLDTQISTSGGGTGGTGGNGVAGQNGGASGPGGSGADDAGGGGDGGPGSNGGAGGPGSGGGGGPSACIAHTAAATTSSTGLSCIVGAPGFGGSGGTNPQGGSGSPGQTGSNGTVLVVN